MGFDISIDTDSISAPTESQFLQFDFRRIINTETLYIHSLSAPFGGLGGYTKNFMHKIALLLLTIAFIGCNNANRMNETERNLIESGDYNTPFRVLTINDADDLKVLRTQCKDLNFERDSALIKKLAARLLATMIAENGVGIAAPQIGISRNIFLFMRINHPNHPVEIAINPRIINKPSDTICFEGDGCLSIPEIGRASCRERL